MRSLGACGFAGVVLAYAVLATLTTWPLVLHPSDHVVGHGPREATAALNIWSMAWVVHQLPRDPVHLFDANSFHPYARTLAFSEHLFVPALLAAPAAAASGNWVLAYNALSLGTLVLAGVAMFALARHLTGDPLAAFGAGALYAFHSWNINELVRIQILSNAWFPLLVLTLLRYFERPRWRTAAAVAVLYALQSLSCMYWALYAPLLVVLVVAVLQAFRRLPPAALARLAGSVLVALLVVAPFLLAYVRTSRELGFARSVPDALPVSRYLAVLPGNLLYGTVLEAGSPNEGAAHFPGLLAVALAAIGLLARRSGAAPVVRVLLGTLIAAGLLLSLGPRIELGGLSVPGPYALLRAIVPGFGHVRYPERFALFVMLGMAPAAAFGLARLRPHVGRAAGGLVLLLWVEHLAVPLHLDPLAGGGDIPEVYQRLARSAGVGVVAEVPAYRHRLERFDALPMYYSTAHWKRTVEGFSGYFPPTYNFTKWRLLHFPDPESVSFLERFGVDALVVHGDPRPLVEAGGGRWTLEGPFAGGQSLLRLRHASQGPSFEVPRPLPVAEIPRAGWKVQASSPGAERAIDGDPETAWSTPEKQTKGEFYRVRLPTPQVVSRISVAVRAPYEFPLRLRLMLQDPDETWAEVELDEGAAYDALFARLLRRPLEASLDLDIPPRVVAGFRLRIAETDPFWMPWTMAEIRAYGPAGGAPPPR